MLRPQSVDPAAAPRLDLALQSTDGRLTATIRCDASVKKRTLAGAYDAHCTASTIVYFFRDRLTSTRNAMFWVCRQLTGVLA
jgi:hypothetical protein